MKEINKIIYKLETGSGIRITNPTSAQIEETIRGLDDSTNKFAILGKSKMEYIQIDGGAKVGYRIEHQIETNEGYSHYESIRNDYTVDEIITVFNRYLLSDYNWKTSVKWRKSDFQPPRKGASLKLVPFLSNLSFIISMCMLGYLIYDTKIKNNSGLSSILGMDGIYFLTFMLVFLAIGFMNDVKKWGTLRVDGKTRAICSIVLAIFMLFVSFLKFLG